VKLTPILTEKSLAQSKEGRYAFWVDKGLNKHKIKLLAEETFGVKVLKVHTQNYVGETKKTNAGKIKRTMPKKKAIITLGGKDKIDLFEEKK